MTKRPRFEDDGTSVQEMADDKVSQPQESDQGQVGGPEVPLPGHGQGVQMSISYRSNRDPAQPGGNAIFVSAANLLH